MTIPKASVLGSNALEGRAQAAWLHFGEQAGPRRWAQAAVDSRWGNGVLFLLQEWSLELSSLVTPHNSRWLQIYDCIFPNLEGFHFWPHKREKHFPFLSMTSIFYSETKSIIAMPGKATHLIIFPENSSEFWDGFSLARAFPPPSKRNCLWDSQFFKR